MAIASREALTEYALRALGEDVVEVNVSEDQASDRLDEALEWFRDYHSEGVERMFLKHQVVGTQITVSSGNADLFTPGETVITSPSGVSFSFMAAIGTNVMHTKLLGGTLAVGETLTGQTSGTVATVASTGSPAVAAVTVGDFENRWIPLTDAIIGVNNVLPLNQNYSGADFNMFDVRYQIMLNDMFSLTNINMLYYTQVQSHLSMINHFIRPETTFQFNRHQNRLFLNYDWDKKVGIGDWIIVDCYAMLDPTTWTDVYNDRILKEYYIALLKRQWGNNLKKFEGMQLPGGVTLNGQQIYTEAVAEIEEIRQRFVNSHQLPVDFLVG